MRLGLIDSDDNSCGTKVILEILHVTEPHEIEIQCNLFLLWKALTLI
jgi:hypothetical protein